VFNLIRYYSIASLLCIVSAAALLGLYYRHLSVAELQRLAEDRNLALATVFGNTLSSRLSPLLADSKLPAKDNASIDGLLRDVTAMMKNSLVVKVKVYNLQGLTVFSTDRRQIGERKASNKGFISAAAGRVISYLTHRDHFDAF
jgi:hypothetical protein